METTQKNVWDFVQEHYENYHGCDEIAENDDLYKIVNNEEIEEDSAAFRLFEEFTSKAGTEEGAMILAEQALHESNANVFQRAIEDFLAKQETEKI